jgi:hypothetical protein
MFGHESAAMTLDVYAELFDSDLSAAAHRGRPFVRLQGAQGRTKRQRSASASSSHRYPASRVRLCFGELGYHPNNTTLY